MLESELGASLFHTPSRETVFTSTSTLGHKPFLFIPQQVSLPAVAVCVCGKWACGWLGVCRHVGGWQVGLWVSELLVGVCGRWACG